MNNPMTDDKLLALDNELLRMARAIADNPAGYSFTSAEVARMTIAMIERHNAEVERLTREREENAFALGEEIRVLRQEAEAAESALAAAQKRVGELSGAARPFSEIGGDADMQAFHDLEDDVVIYQNSGKCITAGDVRRLRRTIAEVDGIAVSEMHRRAE